MTDHVSTHAAEEDIRNEAILIYVNGRIVPKQQALVSVYDSGFMLGDVSGRASACIRANGPSSMNTWTACSRQQRPSIWILA
jgi:hypothetical protein